MLPPEPNTRRFAVPPITLAVNQPDLQVVVFALRRRHRPVMSPKTSSHPSGYGRSKFLWRSPVNGPKAFREVRCRHKAARKRYIDDGQPRTFDQSLCVLDPELEIVPGGRDTEVSPKKSFELASRNADPLREIIHRDREL